MKTRETKQKDLEALTESLQSAKSAMVVSFAGLSVNKDQEFRNTLRTAGAKYQVVKNTLARRAVKDTQFEQAAESFKGVTAIAWTESRFDRVRNSPKGARGAMQLMPATAQRYGVVEFDSAGKAQLFFYDRTNNEARRAVLTGSTWAVTDLRAGGREMHTSLSSAGKVAYSTLDEKTGQLNVYVI